MMLTHQANCAIDPSEKVLLGTSEIANEHGLISVQRARSHQMSRPIMRGFVQDY